MRQVPGTICTFPFCGTGCGFMAMIVGKELVSISISRLVRRLMCAKRKVWAQADEQVVTFFLVRTQVLDGASGFLVTRNPFLLLVKGPENLAWCRTVDS
ncbi:hypothetical protein DUNSADRAFT_7236 [Dunaliella salina]|uniref:Encoded protein n=1 Tax=Dunaliella salina TaxID=3046 RepID=A0ABQ7GLQ1_DUNSA|nr:hypothetical protein DUNSADRAFT_7236 [Dunaliella salina]|eukprot:KAF5835537.1 hypothetical protein DUNSADRAFT_7236 [Dunaliella salina]